MPKKVKDISSNGNWIHSFTEGGNRFVTRSGAMWSSMKQRCNTSGVVHKKRPSYAGCTYSDNFANFQFFADWHVNQAGYTCGDYELDKDILVGGNKMYHEDRCVLVPRALNCFLTGDKVSKGQFPQGICAYRDGVRVMAYTSSNGIRKHIGIFKTVSEAQTAYVQAKSEEARAWYARLCSGEFQVDSRLIERMRTWEFIYD